MSRIYEKFCELLSAHIEADEKWMPIQKANELLGSVNEDEIWEQRNAAANALYKYIAELEGLVDKLIEAGDALDSGLDNAWNILGDEEPLEEQKEWREIVKDRKGA